MSGPGRPRSARCGTPSGYSRHQLDAEKPCDACAAAKAAYDRRHKAAPEHRQRDRLRAMAQRRAVKVLCDENGERYRELYKVFVAEVFADAGMEP